MDLGDWSIRNWRALAGLTSALLVVSGGLAGSITDYRSYFPALGGPNGLLYDLTLKVAQPWRRNIPTVPAVFVAVDDASLSTPDLAALPRALFQPVWARLIDGLLEARARRIAFDVVFAYAGADFQVGSFVLPDYDGSLIDSLGRARDRIVLGRFPSIPPAPPFLSAVGASRVGVLDLQLESDGRVRSTAPLVRLADGRIALGFAALAAGLSVRQASAAQRILIAPYAPITDTPTYGLATLLGCLSSEEGREQVQGDILTGPGLRLGRDGERLLVELLRLAGIGLQQVDRGQVGEGLRQTLIGRRQILLQRADHLLEHRGCLGVPAQRLVGAGQVVQRRDVGEVVGAATLGGCLGFLGLRKGRRIVPGSIEILKALLCRSDVDLLRHGRRRRRCHRNDRHDKEGDQPAPPSRSHDLLQRGGRNYRTRANFIWNDLVFARVEILCSLKLIPVRGANSLRHFCRELPVGD